MRPRSGQIVSIRRIARTVARPAARVRAFGSRPRANAAGGDLDGLEEQGDAVDVPADLVARLSARVSRPLQGRTAGVAIPAPDLRRLLRPRGSTRGGAAAVTLPPAVRERLALLVRGASREARHRTETRQRLFAVPLTPEQAESSGATPEIAERVDASVNRFGRLQDTLGETLLPTLLAVPGEQAGAQTDNLDPAQRLRFTPSADRRLKTRRLPTSVAGYAADR
jgi:hypothetical protein